MKILVSIVLIIVSVILFGATLRGMPGNPRLNIHQAGLDRTTKPFELSSERDRYLLTASLAENHSFSLPKQVADANNSDIGYYNNKYYILFPPGISVLALPFYTVGKLMHLSQVVTFSMSSVFCIFTMFFLYKIARNVLRMPFWISVFVPLIYGFGSTSWSYAVTLYQHQVTTFLLISTFYAVWKFKQKTKGQWLYAAYTWLGYGLGIFVDYPNAVLLLPVMVYFLHSSYTVTQVKDRFQFNVSLPFVFTSVFFIAGVLLHGYYNYTQFGSATRISGSLVSYKTIIENHLNDTNKSQSAILKLADQKKISGFFQENNVPLGFTELSAAPDKGLFVFAPIFILMILGIAYMVPSMTIELGILFSIIFINFLLYSSWDDPWGGWAFGPRYLIPSMAVGSLFIGIFLQKAKHKLLARCIALLLFTFSSAVALLGALTTNAIPPKVEADYLHTSYGFMHAFNFLVKNKSGSYVYNTYMSSHMSLMQYYEILFFVVMTVAIFILFVPFRKNYES